MTNASIKTNVDHAVRVYNELKAQLPNAEESTISQLTSSVLITESLDSLGLGDIANSIDDLAKSIKFPGNLKDSLNSISQAIESASLRKKVS